MISPLNEITNCCSNTTRSLVGGRRSGVGQLFCLIWQPSGNCFTEASINHFLFSSRLIFHFNNIHVSPRPHNHSDSLQLHCFLILNSLIKLRWEDKGSNWKTKNGGVCFLSFCPSPNSYLLLIPKSRFNHQRIRIDFDRTR